jgi:molybdopterin molybdotransferase
MSSPLTTPNTTANDYDPDSMPVEAARTFIESWLTPIHDTEMCLLRDSLGRVLAANIVSPLNVPAHRNAAMDGWAIRHQDVREPHQALTEIGTSFAGKPFTGEVNAGECVRIFTGAVIPEPCDAVVMQERITKYDNVITINDDIKRGQHVREAGEDLREGATALLAGQQIRPAELGLIASLGIGEVLVYRPLRVAYFSTGDELVQIGMPLDAGQLYDSNRYTLHGMLTRMGMEAIDLGVVADNPLQLKKILMHAASIADVVITTGGVSVGEADYIKAILAELGEVVFWKIAMKPGRPLAYGKIAGAHFFGLPGNPVSVMVTFYQFVRDALLILQGVSPLPIKPLFKAVCTTPIKKNPGRTEFQRGVLFLDGGDWRVRTTGAQGSGILSSMSQANCFIVLNDNVGNVAAGTVVDVQLLEGII